MIEINTNIKDYTLSELMDILELNDFDANTIIQKTEKYYQKYIKTEPKLAIFFREIQSNLLQYISTSPPINNPNKIKIKSKPKPKSTPKITSKHIEGFTTNMESKTESIYPTAEKQVNDWYTNEVLEQSDENQTQKITDRKQKIDIFGNAYVPMNREQIATTDTYQLPIKQDSLNPNLKNTITRFINIDSQFRQYTNGVDSGSTNFTFDLSDTLKDVLSLRLYSYQIPYTWYTIDESYGNTCMWVIHDANIIPISISAGNYTTSVFIDTLNTAFTASGFDTSNNIVSYNANNGILTISLYNVNYVENGEILFTCNTDTRLEFYDFTGNLRCMENSCQSKTNSYFNGTLGWIMGFRLPYVNVLPTGNNAPATLSLVGPKYLLLVIDDYNQNHVNNSLVSITQLSNRLKMPEYYSPDIPSTCIAANQQNNLSELINQVKIENLFQFQNTNPLNGLLIAGKYEEDYTDTQIVLPSAPRTLTQAQLYTINQINNNENNLTNYLARAPTSSDILATVPVKTYGVTTGTLLVEFGSSLQNNIRTYFGPINIERMRVQLLDDKGNILNLHGNDWCITLICDCLYQY